LGAAESAASKRASGDRRGSGDLPEPLRARLSESIEQLERLARRMGALLAEVTRRTPPRA